MGRKSALPQRSRAAAQIVMLPSVEHRPAEENPRALEAAEIPTPLRYLAARKGLRCNAPQKGQHAVTDPARVFICAKGRAK